MRRVFYAACLLISVAIPVLISAQEGHPLTGTWSGDWGPNANDRSHLTFVIKWSGKNVTGTINPGPDAIPIGNIAVDWTKWTVRFEATGKDASGSAVRIAADGKFDDIGSYHRKISGTWSQGAAKGDFKITRD